MAGGEHNPPNPNLVIAKNAKWLHKAPDLNLDAE